MVVDYLAKIENYFSKESIRFINSILVDFKNSKLKIGEWIENEKKDIRAIVLNSSSFKPSIFEAHKTYIDLHLILSGTDTYYLVDSAKAHLETEYNAKQDFELYQANEYLSISLTKDSFCIFQPGEIHSSKLGESSIKIIFKILSKSYEE